MGEYPHHSSHPAFQQRHVEWVCLASGRDGAPRRSTPPPLRQTLSLSCSPKVATPHPGLWPTRCARGIVGVFDAANRAFQRGIIARQKLTLLICEAHSGARGLSLLGHNPRRVWGVLSEKQIKRERENEPRLIASFRNSRKYKETRP
jgi:hypothetical protein